MEKDTLITGFEALSVLTKGKVQAWEFKEIRRVPLKPCPAKTLREAYDAFHKAPPRSEEQRSALIAWTNFSWEELNHASTYSEIVEVINFSLEGSEVQNLAKAKLDTYVQKILSSTNKFRTQQIIIEKNENFPIVTIFSENI